MQNDPFALLERMVAILDEVGVRYAVGGSVASSVLGEPRSTVDLDLAVDIQSSQLERLIERIAPDFYVPLDAARAAVRTRSSFNVLDLASGLKVDLFVLGEGLLDRRQITRRLSVDLPGSDRAIWVTAPEDQILRKLQWYRDGGSVSDRQWRDVVGLLFVCGARLDHGDLSDAARELGLEELLDEARRQAEV